MPSVRAAVVLLTLFLADPKPTIEPAPVGYWEIRNTEGILMLLLSVDGTGDLNRKAFTWTYSGGVLLLNREDNLVLKISLDRFIQSIQNQSLQPKDRFTRSVLVLPEFGGVVAGLSGACIGTDPQRIYFSASVEDKSGTVNDGQILGSYIGWFNADADSLVTPTTYHLVDHVGNRTFDKLESIELCLKFA